MPAPELQIVARTPKQFTEALRRFRRKLNLSQKEVGEKVGLPQTTVSKIEKELISPSLGNLYKLLAALDLEIVIRPRTKGQ
jgi:HTH-type transcriptional regulator/antitoxin HipB